MLNLTAILPVHIALCLALSSFVYALIFRFVARHLLVPSPQAVEVVATEPGRLAYARADLAPLPLLLRRPSLVVVPLVLLFSSPLGTLLGASIFCVAQAHPYLTSLFAPLLVVTSVAFVVSMIAQVLLARRVMIRVAALETSWPLRTPALAALLCCFAFAASFAFIELRARCALAAAEGEMEQLEQALRRPGFADENPFYSQAIAKWKALGIGSVPTGNSVESTPFPPAAESVVALLHEATSSDHSSVSGDRASELAKLLYWHARTELQLGRWNSARRDLAALQTMARQFSYRDSLIWTLHAVIIDGIGEDLVEHLANAADSEAQLDAIPLQPRSWHSHLIRQYRDTLAIDIGRQPITVARGEWTLDYAMIALQRWLLLDADLESARMHRRQLAQAPLPEWDNGSSLAPLSAMPSPGPMLIYPTFTGVWDDVLYGRVRRDLYGAGLAVLRFRFRTGRLPATLDEVVAAGLLEAVPRSPWTGEAAVYTSSLALTTLSLNGHVATRRASFTIATGPTTGPATEPGE